MRLTNTTKLLLMGRERKNTTLIAYPKLSSRRDKLEKYISNMTLNQKSLITNQTKSIQNILDNFVCLPESNPT